MFSALSAAAATAPMVEARSRRGYHQHLHQQKRIDIKTGFIPAAPAPIMATVLTFGPVSHPCWAILYKVVKCVRDDDTSRDQASSIRQY